LSAVLAGSLPAAIAVNAEPEDTLVLINRSFAGRGTVAAQDRPPGTISIELSAPDHKPETVEVELHPGELTRVHVNLWPEEYGEVTIQSPGVHGAAVYHGARYAGEAPLTLRLPLNQLNYVSVEGPGKQMAQAAFITPEQENTPYVFSLKTRPLPAGKDRVNKARKAYYWSWGGTWITGIAAWVVTGILKNNNEAILERWAREGTFDDAFYDQAELMQNVYYGAWAVAGAAAAFEIYQMARYIYTATEDTTPVLKPDRQEKNQ
jgi:hypothetical protein